MRPVEIQPTRPVRTTDRVAATDRPQAAPKAGEGEKDVEVARTDLLSAKEPPVDAERVEQIRQAIADGTYPLVPARIADAMIAAGIMLRSSQ